MHCRSVGGWDRNHLTYQLAGERERVLRFVHADLMCRSSTSRSRNCTALQPPPLAPAQLPGQGAMRQNNKGTSSKAHATSSNVMSIVEQADEALQAAVSASRARGSFFPRLHPKLYPGVPRSKVVYGGKRAYPQYAKPAASNFQSMSEFPGRIDSDAAVERAAASDVQAYEHLRRHAAAKRREAYAGDNGFVGERNPHTGERHGQGTQTYLADGTVYLGAWAHDKRDGVGRLSYADGAVYIGGWRDDRKHGHGRYVWPLEQPGAGARGASHGGAAASTNSTQLRAEYAGHFTDGMRHGPHGIFTNAAGEVVYNGTWRHNQPVLAEAAEARINTHDVTNHPKEDTDETLWRHKT